MNEYSTSSATFHGSSQEKKDNLIWLIFSQRFDMFLALDRVSRYLGIETQDLQMIVHEDKKLKLLDALKDESFRTKHQHYLPSWQKPR